MPTFYRYYTPVNREAAFRGISCSDARFATREDAEAYARRNWPHQTPRIVTGLTDDENSIDWSEQEHLKCKSETCGECVFLPPTGEDGECRMCSERNLWRRVDEPASDAGGLICPLYEPRKT